MEPLQGLRFIAIGSVCRFNGLLISDFRSLIPDYLFVPEDTLHRQSETRNDDPIT